MKTSANELKEQLNNFLFGNVSEEEFRLWFARVLHDAHKSDDLALEPLAHTIQQTFSDAAHGFYTSVEMVGALLALTKDEPAQNTQQNFSNVKEETPAATQTTYKFSRTETRSNFALV